MITERKGNGQTECYGCKEKGKFALTWDSWLYNFDNKPYCFDCLMEKLEELNEENQQLKNNWNELKEFMSYQNINNLIEQGYEVNDFISEIQNKIQNKIQKLEKKVQ